MMEIMEEPASALLEDFQLFSTVDCCENCVTGAAHIFCMDAPVSNTGGTVLIKWVEVFPTSKQVLQREIIAKSVVTMVHGLCMLLWKTSNYVSLKRRYHCSYHPQSGGAVEQENGTIKNKLSQRCEETGPTWIKALPVVSASSSWVHSRPPNTGIRPG